MKTYGTIVAAGARNWRRYLTIYVALWKNSIVREMAFKANFLMWIFVEMLWFAMQLAFVAVIYQHTQHIVDWSKWQVVLLMGAAQFIQQIFQAIFLTNCTQISEHIRTGRLDFMLLLPVNTRFLVSLRQVDLGGFANAATALAVMGYALRQLNYWPSPLQIFVFLLLVATGVLGTLFVDVPARERQFLDGARAGDCVGVLQSVQHRPAAGFGISRFVQGSIYVCHSHAAGRQCAGASARRQTQFAAASAAVAGDGRGVLAGFGNILALLVAALHQRQFLEPV